MPDFFDSPWAAKYRPQRDQYWPEVERYFSRLPPPLFQQAMLLKNNLATFYADTGQFKDILCRQQDHPLLYLHFWLLDDWRLPQNGSRAALEKHLFLAMVFTFAAVYTRQSILDEDANFDGRYLFLAQDLIRQADFHLTQLYPGPSAFWTHQRACWHEHAEAVLWQQAASPGQTGPETAVELWPLTGKLAFTKIPLAAVAISAGREAVAPQLGAMLDHFNLIFQVMQDVFSLRRDLLRRHVTYPIMRAIQAAGLEPQPPLNAEQILGAFVLTGLMEEIGQECLGRLEQARAIATELELPSFMAYLAGVEDQLAGLMELFSVRRRSTAPQSGPTAAGRPRLFPAPSLETLPKVIEMAEGYLLSDLTFRESWEVQRRGLFGLPELTAQAFPAGLIVEILCRHGHDLAEPVDRIFQSLQVSDFRYYDLARMPPDTDDLGLLLRLYPYSKEPDRHRRILQRPLGWLEDNVAESGQIPVWLLYNDTPAGPEQSFVSLWGHHCAAVEANLLLGLIDYDWAGYRTLIEKSAGGLFERLATEGLSAVRHYVPLYSLWVVFELMAKLASKELSAAWPGQLDGAAQALAGQVALETKRPSLSPQEAAFLTLICHSAGLPQPAGAVFKPAWITLLCKSQRYDGSWAGEPLFGTPGRGELATWYASRSVTTAFCYHALKTYRS